MPKRRLASYLSISARFFSGRRALFAQVASLLHSILEHEVSDDSDSNALTTVALRRLTLECLLLLMTLGCVLPCLAAFEAWLSEADLSLVRHLVAQLLALAAPPCDGGHSRRRRSAGWAPGAAGTFSELSRHFLTCRYSEQFARAVLGILVHSKVAEAFRGHGGESTKPMLTFTEQLAAAMPALANAAAEARAAFGGAAAAQ